MGGKQELLDRLERYERGCGWTVERDEDGVVRARRGRLIWIGMAVVSKGSRRPFDFEGRLLELGEERLPKGGELCPFEFFPRTTAWTPRTRRNSLAA